ncbi:MAG: hypothetical protein HKN82_08350 [Akkermansiaceae bacterium]|nr:hypothetical protein [Akkermansiaceae bacterium]NNM29613.1 hypothetical protein [Akkermansiaceae bacterium]
MLGAYEILILVCLAGFGVTVVVVTLVVIFSVKRRKERNRGGMAPKPPEEPRS